MSFEEYKRRKSNNIIVWKDTKKLFETKLNNLKVESSIKYYDKELNVVDMLKRYDKMEIEIKNEDSFTMSYEYLKDRYNPMVLNMASYICPGGGVKKGSCAQEEDLFRRSNYYQCLSKEFYPLKMNEVIYSPEVIVIKDKNNEKMKKGFKVSCLACPAIRKPKLEKNGEYNEEDLKIMDMKIDMIFKVGYFHNHDSLILGALGCGAYENPIEEVINIFNEKIEKYWRCFKKIGFAILNDNKNNYEKFEKNIIKKI
jgi:uncharacterized protein (TIGR02452 family)